MLPVLLLSNDANKITKWLDETIKKRSIKDVFYYGEHETISIDTIREINKEALQPAFRNRMFVLYNFDKIKNEGQNAFLKTLEERNEENHFIIIAEREHQIVPTIVSRTHVIRTEDEQQEDFSLLQKLTGQDSILSHTLQKDEYAEMIRQLRGYLYDQVHKNNHSIKEKAQYYRVLERIIEVEYQLKNNIYPEFTLDYILLLLSQHRLLPLHV
jgi:hypothetical protein